MQRIILASTSPRRRQLLAQIGMVFEVMESHVDENISGTAKEIVRELALRKAHAVAQKIKGNATIIGADTLVSVDDVVLEKPRDHHEAFNMLKLLQGRKHQVCTGVAVIKNGTEQAFVEQADVFFRPLSDDEIHAYMATGEPFDKAGGYGIQGHGATLVQRIEGDFYTVMGLPLCRLYQLITDKL
ncbi:MAG: Maf family protein [Defluviitaleaceae bacterium]|nr:Maf family protein [Defluviitaleaceae bacterium]